MTFHDQNEGRAALSPFAANAIWVASIVGLSVAGGLVFACVAPLIAIAALAGSKMDRGSGFALVIAAWLANQIVGYGFLDYPQTFYSFAWGIAIGFATVLAYLVVRAGTANINPPSLGLVLGFLVAFTTYELALYATGLALSAADGAFAADIVGRIFEINLIAFVGLLALHRLAVSVALLTPASTSARIA
jgi:hypothetical protein